MKNLTEVERGVYVIEVNGKSLEISLTDSPIITDGNGKYYPCNWKNFRSVFLDAYVMTFEGEDSDAIAEAIAYIYDKHFERYSQ